MNESWVVITDHDFGDFSPEEEILARPGITFKVAYKTEDQVIGL